MIQGLICSRLITRCLQPKCLLFVLPAATSSLDMLNHSLHLELYSDVADNLYLLWDSCFPEDLHRCTLRFRKSCSMQELVGISFLES